MVQTYQEDIIYFLGDYKFGDQSKTAEHMANKIIDKLAFHLKELEKEPGMCQRTLRRAIEICRPIQTQQQQQQNNNQNEVKQTNA